MNRRDRAQLFTTASFVVVASVLVLSLWASASPAMVYPLYIDRWNVTPLATTALFSTYPVTLVLALIVTGSLSDRIGRRTVLLAGVTVLATGCLAFVTTDALGWLFAGRVLQGAGVGVALSAAAAALSDFDGTSRPARVSAVNTAATSTGTVLAIVAGGALVQFAPAPTKTPFVALLVVVIIVLIALWFIPNTSGPATSRRWRPTVPAFPRNRDFAAIAGIAIVAAAFAMGGIFLALGAQIAKDVVGTDNVFLSAAALATWPAAGVPSAITARYISDRCAAVTGGLCGAVGSLLLLPAAWSTSLCLFGAAAIVSGVGYGLMFSAGFAQVAATAPPAERAASMSAMYLVSYTAQGTAAVAVGALATRVGLQPALVACIPAIAVACLIASALHVRLCKVSA